VGFVAAVRHARIELTGVRVGPTGMSPSEHDWRRGHRRCAVIPSFLTGGCRAASVGVGGADSITESLVMSMPCSSWVVGGSGLCGVGEVGGVGDASFWKGGIGIGGGVGLISEGG
jgi:hypothetical protein